MVCGKDYHGGNTQNGCGHKFNWKQAVPYVRETGAAASVAAAPPKVTAFVHPFVSCDLCRGEVRGLRSECLNCPASICARAASGAVSTAATTRFASLRGMRHNTNTIVLLPGKNYTIIAAHGPTCSTVHDTSFAGTPMTCQTTRRAMRPVRAHVSCIRDFDF